LIYIGIAYTRENQSTLGKARSMWLGRRGGWWSQDTYFKVVLARGRKHDRFSWVCHYIQFIMKYAHILYIIIVCVCNIVVVTITPPSAVTTLLKWLWVSVCCACARVAMTRLRWRRRPAEVTAWAKSSSSIAVRALSPPPPRKISKNVRTRPNKTIIAARVRVRLPPTRSCTIIIFNNDYYYY